MEVVTRIELPLGASMLEQEDAIEAAVNEAGLISTRVLIESLDTQGKPLKATSKEGTPLHLTAKSQRVIKQIETPYGPLQIPRYVYQSSAGGACLVPLDQAASLLGAATPKFAQMVSHKVAQMPACAVQHDLAANHQRKMSVDQIQQVAARVGALAIDLEPHLEVSATELPNPKKVCTIAIGVDAASMLMNSATAAPGSDQRKARKLDWRMAMVGTLSFYDKDGKRLSTLYLSKSPPVDAAQGKAAFWAAMDEKVKWLKRRYKKARYIGVSDGAVDLATWLAGHTEIQVLDYYHAAAYLDVAAPAFHAEPSAAEEWAQRKRIELRDDAAGAADLLSEMKAQATRKGYSTTAREGLEKAIGYFETRVERMDYAGYRQQNIPIGSGVTESACKLIIKQRLCGPGMRWSHRASQHVMTLRCLLHSDGHWRTLWNTLAPKRANAF